MADHGTNTATKIPTAELDRLAREAGMMSVLPDGAGSFVWSAGCNGVTQEHLERFAELVTARALAAPVPAAHSQVRAPASPGLAAQGATQEPAWTLTFADERDFCLAASPIIGAAYTGGVEAIKRINGKDGKGLRAPGRITAGRTAHAGQAETTAQLTDEQIEQIAHRQAWRYKHHDDPAQREYTFTRHRLLDFVQAVQSQPGDAE